jgi:ankyrin repeat protein
MNRITLIVAFLMFTPLQSLAQETQDINKLTSRGNTKLIEAIMLLDIYTTKSLIEAGADVNIKGRKMSKTALHYAAEALPYTPDFAPYANRTDQTIKISDQLVKLLIDAGADVNALDDNGNSPLSYGARVETPEITKLLINAPAGVNLIGVYKGLLTASNFGKEENARLILDKLPANDAVDSVLNMVLSMASNGQFSLDFIKAIHKKGVDLKQNSNILFNYARKGTPEMVQYLLTNGVDVNVRDFMGNTAIANTFAFQEINQPVIDILLKAKIEINFKNIQGQNILGVLANQDISDSAILCSLLKQFIDAGAHINATDNEGNTPLMLFLKNIRKGISGDNIMTYPVLMLINAGADVNIPDSQGNIPFCTAVNESNKEATPEVIMALIQKTNNVNCTEDYSPMIWACDKGQVEIVRLLIKKGVNVNRVISNPYTDFSTALIWASATGRTEVVKLLIQAKADVNKGGRAHGTTPLMFAARNGHVDVVRLLLAAKANVAARNNGGMNAAAFAVGLGKIETAKILIPYFKTNPTVLGQLLLVAAADTTPSMVKLLIDYKANVNVKSKEGYTPIMLAINGYIPEMVKMLIDAKANVNSKSLTGDTPLSLAKENGIQEIIDMLIMAGAK